MVNISAKGVSIETPWFRIRIANVSVTVGMLGLVAVLTRALWVWLSR